MTIITMAAINCNTKKTTPDLLPDLPWEVICNIMSRTPITTILKFRIVSKNTMNNFLHDPYVISLHSTHQSPLPSIILYQNYKIERFELLEKQHDGRWVHAFIPIARELLDKRLRVVASCNGLLCLLSEESSSGPFIIYNLVTRELKICKSLSLDVRRECCLGFDSKTNTYKLIVVYDAFNGLFVVITTIGVGGSSWRKLELPIELDRVRFYCNACKPVFFNGEVYLIITSYLLVIDVSNEICRLINITELSRTVCGWNICNGLYKYGEHLFLLQLTKTGVNTWQLDTNRGIIGQRKGQHHTIFEDYHVEFAGTVGNGEFLFKTFNKRPIVDTKDCYKDDRPYTLVTYDLETGKLSHLYGSIPRSCDALPFVANLAPFSF